MNSSLPGADSRRSPSQLQNIYRFGAWLLAAAALLQVALAFLGIPFAVHRALGLTVGLLGLAVAVSAVAGQLSSVLRWLSAAILILLLAQPLLILLSALHPVAGDIHGFNGLLIAALAVFLVLAVEDERRPEGEED